MRVILPGAMAGVCTAKKLLFTGFVEFVKIVRRVEIRLEDFLSLAEMPAKDQKEVYKNEQVRSNVHRQCECR